MIHQVYKNIISNISFDSQTVQKDNIDLSAIIRLICVNPRSIILGIIFLLYSNLALTQNYNWITPNQTYLKMYVTSDGMYRIDKNDFVNAGINVTTIDPKTVKLYYKGNQIPIYFFGGRK